ncbi:MAG: TetR family transcriptional regulator C-terminal domain-containing protein [Sporomusaceae bacterium]|nr:TetR family transcriptional regulator C-terminal domain-containing protein [Sporomusaceae bacterium]
MDKQNVRLHLIEIGAKAFMAKGYHAVGLKEILAAAQVPKGSFYYYFRSKEDFCIAIIDHYIRLYAERHLTILFDSARPVRDRLLAFFAQEKEYFREKQCQHGCLLAKLALEMALLSEPIRAELQRGMNGWIRTVAACLAEGEAADEFTLFRPPAVMAEFLYAAWAGAITRMQATQSLEPLDIFISFAAREIGGQPS